MWSAEASTTGTRGVGRWLADLYEAWETFELTTEEFIDGGGDSVIVVLHARGWGQASGIEVEHTAFGVSTLRDGKVNRVRWFSSREEALAAA